MGSTPLLNLAVSIAKSLYTFVVILIKYLDKGHNLYRSLIIFVLPKMWQSYFLKEKKMKREKNVNLLFIYLWNHVSYENRRKYD